MDLNKYLADIKEIDYSLESEIQAKLDNLTKPVGSLGRLEELAKKYCLIRNTVDPDIKDKVIFTLAADHGIAQSGISAYPSEVTYQMVLNFIGGGAGINVLSKYCGARVIIADMGVKGSFQTDNAAFKDKKISEGTKSIINGPAMTREEALRSVVGGIELVEEELEKGLDIIGIGDMGIGNTTASSAIVSVFTGRDAREVTGIGTGIGHMALVHKIDVIEKAIKINKPEKTDPLDVLSKIGGFEIGGLAGVIIAGAANNIPVVIDGFISGAAALIAVSLKPQISDYLIASHCSVEPGHRITLDHMGLKPLLDLDLRLGEGTGAVMGIWLLEAGIKLMNEMATFEKAGVSKKNA
ncbi:nicotinate-nucleotide--dimethylbenzimidazole phosphoribosyltransferase [Elusimicrobiota bacterium]